ncbi:hypothetical protein K450DRAFT_251183 [Umbelopsis ramanniana AG]|uniref:S1-like domain-containing protein n=1 Tax=Umbelopsis ramanniana AG TaxID=1314678 RepID=A0AAD5HB69_UMBRA|nr:uncharacterized protein K450DRAFT_251183 [Umbelopsis ramanniana AG]KAI8577667.1 hypothetical protein K450DRAFT_251183 [Umbelopsis ramanniana AG]
MGKKQTTRQAESTPELTSSQVIARVVGPRGKNMHEVQYADGQTTLAVLPPRFRNLIWVKRGHYVVLDPEATSSDKMGGEIVHVLFPEHVKDLRAQGKWPEEFNTKSNPTPSSRSNDIISDSEENSDDDLFVNNNRPVMEETDSDSDDEDSEESGDDNHTETQA